MTENKLDACFDIPDNRDRVYEELVGNADKNKKEIPEFTRYDQTKHQKTRMACTRYALWMISNIQNIQESLPIDEEYNEIDPIHPRLDYLMKDPRAEQNGASLQSALNQIKSDWLIEWYAKVESIQAMEQAIDRSDYIYTWLRNYKRAVVGGKAIYAFPWNGWGHAIMIYKYDKDFWIWCDSSWWLDLYIKKTDFDKLYTKYAIIDKKDIVDQYKKKKLIKEIIQMNSDLWNKYHELELISWSRETLDLIDWIKDALNKNNNYFRSVWF